MSHWPVVMPVTFSIKQASSKGQARTEKPPVRVSVQNLETKTVGELKLDFLKSINKPGLGVSRVRFSQESNHEILGPNEKVLSTFKFPKESTEISLLYKDLGPQISWRTVFVVEYFFPMVIFPALWVLVRKFPHSLVTQLIYPTASASAPTAHWQDLLALLFTLHFIKRELETVLVHRFGTDTMPVTNIFKNSGYYWVFAFWIAHITMHPLYTMPACSSQRTFGVGLFLVSELLNLKCHIDLRNLRPEGTRIRKVPHGILFNLVSCPNYMFEVLSWVGFTLASQSVAAAAFTLVGAAQMTLWAIQKHKRYRKEFDGKDGREAYPKGRRAIVPFIL